MSNSFRVAKNTGFLYIRIIVNIFISLYSTRIVLAELGVDDFGIYNLIAGTIALFVFLNSAMAEATQRFMSHALGEKNFKKQQSVFSIGVILHFLISLFIVLILEVSGYFLFKSVLVIPEERLFSAKVIFQFMVVSNFFTIITVPYNAVLNSHENMFIVALLGICESIIKLGIAIYITVTSYDQLIAYGLLMAILSIIILLSTRFYCSKKYAEVHYRFKEYFDWKLFKEMASFASWTLVSHSAWVITMQGTSIVLNAFFGVAINAAQGIAHQVTNQLKGFSMTMLRALNPFIVKKEGENDRKKMLEASSFGNKISFFILTFLSIPLLVEMNFVLDLWLKDVPDFAMIFCQLSLLRIIIGALTQTYYYSIGAIGKIKIFSIIESGIMFSVLPTSYLLYKFGADPTAIYINMILVIASMGVARVYFIKKLGGLDLKVFMSNVLFRCIAVFVACYAITSFLKEIIEPGFVRFTIVLLLSSASLLVLVYFLGLNKSERKIITGLVNSFLIRIKR